MTNILIENEDLIYVKHLELISEIDLGAENQVRYLQGDAEAVMIFHQSRWHRVPLGGIVSGPRGAMRVAPIYSHRTSNVTLEFGSRFVEMSPTQDTHAKFKDELRVSIDWNLAPDPAGDVVRYIAPAQGQYLRVGAHALGKIDACALVSSSDIARGGLAADTGAAIAKASLAGRLAQSMIEISTGAGDFGLTPVHIDLRDDFMVTDRSFIKLTCPAAHRDTQITTLRAMIAGVPDA